MTVSTSFPATSRRSSASSRATSGSRGGSRSTAEARTLEDLPTPARRVSRPHRGAGRGADPSTSASGRGGIRSLDSRWDRSGETTGDERRRVRRRGRDRRARALRAGRGDLGASAPAARRARVRGRVRRQHHHAVPDVRDVLLDRGEAVVRWTAVRDRRTRSRRAATRSRTTARSSATSDSTSGSTSGVIAIDGSGGSVRRAHRRGAATSARHAARAVVVAHRATWDRRTGWACRAKTCRTFRMRIAKDTTPSSRMRSSSAAGIRRPKRRSICGVQARVSRSCTSGRRSTRRSSRGSFLTSRTASPRAASRACGTAGSRRSGRTR